MSQSKRLLLLLLPFLFIASLSTAQFATLRGFVYLKKTGEPILYTSVYLEGTTYGASTDVNGYFSLTHIPVGDYVVVVGSLGYDTVREKVKLSKDLILSKKFYLQETNIVLGQVEISAKDKAKTTQTNVSTYIITPQDMKSIPTLGGQPDLAQYLQVLPGVVFTGDQGGKLYIEGGQPIQNLVLLDGMTVFNPFHSIGLFSVFDGDVLSDATVYAGGFNAEFGDRISSVMDIHTRDGNKKRVSGKVDISPFGAHALVEGPLLKNPTDDPDKTSASFILSVKNSFLGQTSKTLYPYIDSGKGVPFDYADYYGKVSLNFASGSKLNVSGFDNTDNVNYPGIVAVNWQQAGGGFDFLFVPNSTNSLTDWYMNYSEYGISMTEADISPSSSSISTFNLGFKGTGFHGNTTIYYGVNISATETGYNFYNSANRSISDSLNSDELSGYVKIKFITKNKRFVIEPGFHLQYYGSFGIASPEPRFDMKYNATTNFRLKFAAGLYSQNLVSAIDERDVVDLFYGVLTSPPTSDIPSTLKQQNGTVDTITSPLQRAFHITGGFEYEPVKRVHINVEAYEKVFLQTTTLNYNKIYDDNTSNLNIADTLKKPFLVETGKAYGADISIRYDYKDFSFYGVYSLGYVTYWDGSTSYPPPFDRRNNVNLVVSYQFGKDKSWQVNVRFNYGSGFPFTPTQGFYPMTPFSNINTNYTTTNSQLGVLYGGFDSERLPDYARMDISAAKSMKLSQNVGLEFNASIINVLDRANIFYYNRITGQIVNQLPIMPSLSVGMTF
jgi:hypothetical protein